MLKASGYRAVALSTAADVHGMFEMAASTASSLLTHLWPGKFCLHIPKTKAVELHPWQVRLRREGKFQQTFLDLMAHLRLKSGAGVSTNSLPGVRHGYPDPRASTTDGWRKDDGSD